MQILELQESDNDCGAAVLHAVLKFYGIRCTYKKLKKIAGTNKSQGTGSAGMLKALDHFRLNFGVLQSASRSESYRQLRESQFVTILCVDNNNHWVLKIAQYGDLTVLFDPEVGVCLLTKRQLLKRWANNKGEMYAIGVYRSIWGADKV